MRTRQISFFELKSVPVENVVQEKADIPKSDIPVLQEMQEEKTDIYHSKAKEINTESLGMDFMKANDAPINLFNVPHRKKPERKIEDFGEKIGGAKKDFWAELFLKNSDINDIAQCKMSKLFPEPSYPSLTKNGFSKFAAGMIHAGRDIISIIKRNYVGKFEEEKIRKIMQFLKVVCENKAINDPETVFKFCKEKNIPIDDAFFLKAQLYAAMEHSSALSKYEIKKDENQQYILFERDTLGYAKNKIYANSIPELGKRLNEKVKAEAKESKKKNQDLEMFVCKNKHDLQYYVCVKINNKNVNISGGFPTQEAANEYKDEKREFLLTSFAAMKIIPSERNDVFRKRKGTNWRSNKNIHSDEYKEVLGFRGVQFGNWLTDANRQDHLNASFDAYCDLAEILNCDPLVVSLDKTLGMAYGARGGGAASAHYEPKRTVINLTKTRGPGCVAHEWFHALDNYIATLYGRPADYVSSCYDTLASHVNAKFPKDLANVIHNLRKVVDSSDFVKRSENLDLFRSKKYWTEEHELFARAFEKYVQVKIHEKKNENDYLVNIKENDNWNTEYKNSVYSTYPYPTKNEMEKIVKAFDMFFEKVKEHIPAFKDNDLQKAENEKFVFSDEEKAYRQTDEYYIRKQRFLDLVAKCGTVYRRTAELLLEEAGEKFFVCVGTERAAPGTKHHGYPGGLLQHAIGAATLASVAQDADSDFVRFAALFHDIGKCYENDETRRQKKFHSEIGMEVIADALKRAGACEDTIEKCRHCIAAHHGSIENGAMEVPKCREAEILAGADRLDGSIMLEYMDKNHTPVPWQDSQITWRRKREIWTDLIENDGNGEKAGEFLKGLPEEFLELDFVKKSLEQIDLSGKRGQDMRNRTNLGMQM